MRHVKGWETTTPEVGEYLQIGQYDAQIEEVHEEDRKIAVEIFYDDDECESECEWFTY